MRRSKQIGETRGVEGSEEVRVRYDEGRPESVQTSNSNTRHVPESHMRYNRLRFTRIDSV